MRHEATGNSPEPVPGPPSPVTPRAKRAEIIAEARTWLKTRWQHQGRLKGVAVDCAGVVIETGKACGCVPRDGSADSVDYGREPNPFRMHRALKFLFDPVPKAFMQDGDILWLRAGDHAQHLGILTTLPDGRPAMIHALDDGVRESPLDEAWQRKIVAVFSYRGLED